MAETIGIGMVGTGMIAGAHATAAKDQGGAKIVAVFDTVPERARAFAETWGGVATSSLEELIAHTAVDAVIVASPPGAHAEATIAALEAGKHVLCEKPFAHTLEDAAAMVRAAERSSAFLACCSGRMRSTPAHLEARRIIDAGDLGDVYYARYSIFLLRSRPGHHWGNATWFMNRAVAGGGGLLDAGVYATDAALYMLGNPAVESVTAQTYVFADDRVAEGVIHDVEDHGVMMLQCTGGKSVVIEAAWVSNIAPPGGAVILGTKAGLRLDPLTKITVREPSPQTYEAVEEEIYSDPGIIGEQNVYYVTARFLDDIAAGRQPHTSPRESLEIMRILEAAYRSAEAGTSVTLAEVPV